MLECQNANTDELVAEVRKDQRRRWLQGERRLVEQYLDEFPLLQTDDLALVLIYGEYLLRCELQEQPTLTEYAQRFPHHAERLRQQDAVHRLLTSQHESFAEPPSTDRERPAADADTIVFPSGNAQTADIRTGWPLVPGFDIIGELGRGGMGIVYKARQVALNRVVAIKMISGGAQADPEHQRRFQMEAEAIARLHHPNFVQVYDYGLSNHQPYLALEFIEGGTLAQISAGVPLPPQRAAQVVETLAFAIDHAHRSGLIHRDLKPANILLTADGVLKITDFGLAKQLEDKARQTATGALLGTPTYMAPEQVSSERQTIGPPADIYGLGVILYELLTGRTPFRGANPLEVLHQVREEEPLPPRRLRPNMPRDLETICLKCLQKDPRQRYGTAALLAEDLRRFQVGEPISARPIGAIARTWRWSRRKPVVASLAGALVLIVTSSIVGLSALYLNADRQRRLAEQADEKAQAAAVTAQQGEASARVSEAETKGVLEFFQKKILAAAGPKGQQGGLGPAATIRDAVERAESSIGQSFADQPRVEASVRQVLGHSYWFLSDYPRAITQHKRALALRQTALGTDHPDTLKSMVSLAQDYDADGRRDDALKLYQQALKLCEERLGPNDTETLWSLRGVANGLRAAGRVKEAVPLYEEALRRARIALGPDHDDTLIYMSSLADAYRNAGQLEQALALFAETLKLERAKKGANHPDVLMTMNNYGVAYIVAGKFDEAAVLLREAEGRMKTELGKDHLQRLNTLHNLAVAYGTAGRATEARPVYEEVLRLKKAKLGPNHESTLLTMGSLAATYQNLGRLNDSLALLEQVLQRAKPDYPWRLQVTNQTGGCLIRMKRYQKAASLLRDCLALRMRKDPGDWWVFQTKSQLGQALTGLHEYQEAEVLLREAQKELAARKSTIPPRFHRYIGQSTQALADLYEAWGKQEEAAYWRKRMPATSTTVKGGSKQGP